jgi:signal transduction histidine kinase
MDHSSHYVARKVEWLKQPHQGRVRSALAPAFLRFVKYEQTTLNVFDCFLPRLRSNLLVCEDARRTTVFKTLPMIPIVAAKLADHLRAEREAVTEHWIEAVRASSEIPSAQKLSHGELSDHLPELFDNLVEYVHTSAGCDARRRVIQASRQHGNRRWDQGYNLAELLRELGTVHRLIIRDVIRTSASSFPHWGSELEEADEVISAFFEDALVGSAEQYVQNFGSQLRKASESLAEANEKLSKADASRLQLIRTVSHDLGNFLNSLTWLVNAFGHQSDETERRKMIEVTERNLADMRALLGELMDYSVLLAGEVQPNFEEISLASLCEDLAASFSEMARSNGMLLKIQWNDDLVTVRSDRRRIKQIVGNLISNAIKYRRQERSDGSVEALFVSLPAQRWQLIVKDTGIGIPRDQLLNVFQEFRRVAPRAEIQGAGLGLAITKRLVGLLQGEIAVSSELGKGTQFAITFPMKPD